MSTATLTKSSLLPVPPEGILSNPDWHIWGGSVVPCGNEWYRIFARWRRCHGFNGWVTHSEIACAVGDNPVGPFDNAQTILGPRALSAWDGANCHNPLPLFADGKFWLFYTGNTGNGDFWCHRNNQRIGVAVADHPMGPWEQFDAPLIAPTPGSWDHLMTALPSVARGSDGIYRMLYKGVSAGPPPFGGNVRVGLATAAHPAGPWMKQDGNFFFVEGEQFPSDDNCLWFDGVLFRAIVKDYGRHFQDRADEALVLFESDDARTWHPTQPDPLLATFSLNFVDRGLRGPFSRLEQPEVVCDSNGHPIVLCLSVKEETDEVNDDIAYAVQVPLTNLPRESAASLNGRRESRLVYSD